MTHQELVERAVRWLNGTMRCRFVLAEAHTSGEIPDAIGWARGLSHLVECKVSLRDWQVDQRKRWRTDRGLGLFRWYMTPPGLLRGLNLPALWGLLEVHPKIVRRVIPAEQIPLAWWRYESEIHLLARRAVRNTRGEQSGDGVTRE